METNFIPYVIQKTTNGERAVDIYSRMLDDRVIFMTGPVHDQMAAAISAQMLYLEAEDSSQDITLYIDSPGGSVTAGMTIYNTMKYISCDVVTIVTGQAASMGSFIAMSGAPGKRFVLGESRTMIHRVSSGTSGTSGTVHVQELQLEDVKRSLDEAQRLNRRLTEIYCENTGKQYDEMYELMKFDTFYSAQEAVQMNLADSVITSR